MDTRIEHDLLGEREVPADAYWGIHTLRAAENFPISGVPIGAYPRLIEALAYVKQAAAETNASLGLLDTRRRDAIAAACRELREGRWHQHFIVDVVQGGAGTSTNMNANEVIANRALELLGLRKGQYEALHPNEHVNLGQSTNDVYPTALKVALWFSVRDLVASVAQLRRSFLAKSLEFAGVLKVGRTQLQDAVPMTLGQEFATYAVMMEASERRLEGAADLLREINLGGTAIGTGINVHPGYIREAGARLSALTGIDLDTAPDLIASTQDCDAFVHLSGTLKGLAVKLTKICNDLRLLSSGPQAGLREINLPARQSGSSIMPGKVNPVIPEVVNQIAFAVMGNDLTVTLAAQAGQLQLNAFEPVIACSLFNSIAHLRNGCATLAERCVEGISANEQRLQEQVMHSIGIATALNPHIGYANAVAVVEEARASRRSIRAVVLERGLFSAEQIDLILAPHTLVGPRPWVGPQARALESAA